MAYWQHGYAISVRNLFEGCCHVCSTLVIYHGTKRSNSTAVNPERVPVLDHYPEEYLNEMFKKSPSQYYRFNVCKGKSLLDLYPLAQQGFKILPISEQLQNMNGPEKHQIALAGLFSMTEKAKNPVYGQFDHRKELWVKWQTLEQRTMDQDRYNNRGGQLLLKEEKEGNDLPKRIPEIQNQLLVLARHVEKRNS